MSTKSKLEANNVKISKANKSLLSIRNAVLRPLTEFNLVNTSDATATPSDILSGKTAYIKGNKVTGTHVCESSGGIAGVSLSEYNVIKLNMNETPSTGVSVYTSTEKSSTITINGNSSNNTNIQLAGGNIMLGYRYGNIIATNLSAENIKSGISILGVTGTFPIPSGHLEITTKGVYDVSDYETAQVVDSNLIPGNIKKGEVVLGVPGTYEGDTTQEDGLITGEITSYTNDRITNVIKYAFYYYSNLTSVSLPNATSIGDYAFSSCSNLTSVSLPNATSIGDYAFSSCSNLTIVSLPNATSIGAYAFSSCSSLTSVSLPNATSIGGFAFNYCSKLESVNIPNVTSIGEYAFNQCNSLIKLVITQTDSICKLNNSNAFGYCYHFLGTVNSTYNPEGLKDGRIYVPDSLVDSYKSATNWSAYADIIVPLSTLVE